MRPEARVDLPRRRVPAPRVAALLLALTLGVGACGVPADGGPPRAGDVLPNLGAVTLDGDSVYTDAYRGQALLLNLWATWCPPCRAEMPWLQEVADRYEARGLGVVGLSVDDGRATGAIERFLEQAEIRYPILHDPSMKSMDRLGILGLPATFLVDPDGRVTRVITGPLAEGDSLFLAQVEAVLPKAGTDAVDSR